VRARALARASQVANNNENAELAERFAQEALALGKALDDKPSIARALLTLSVVNVNSGKEESGWDLVEQSLHVALEIEDHGIAAANLLNLGIRARDRGPKSAIPLMERALQESRLSGDKRMIGFILKELSLYVLVQGNLEYAQSLAEEAMSLFQEMGDKGNLAAGTLQLTDIALFSEEYMLAGEYCLRAKELSEAVNSKHDAALSLWYLGLVDWAKGDLPGFRGATEQALSLVKESPDLLLIIQLPVFLGESSRLEGDLISAKGPYREALKILQEVDIRAGYCLCLEGLAALAIANGQSERGARLFGAWEKLREDVFVLDNYPFLVRQRESHISAARAQLGEEAFQSAWETGREMSFEAARELMIELSDFKSELQ
jgi:hypothetical protein